MSYDVHFESVQQQGGIAKGLQFLTFGNYKRTLAVRGIQKLVNKFLKCLLTPAGTDISDKEYGTALMNLMLASIDQTSVKQIVTIAVRDAVAKVQEYDLDNAVPDDERLTSVTVEGLDFDSANLGFDLYLRLTNVAGTTVILLVPDMKKFTE